MCVCMCGILNETHEFIILDPINVSTKSADHFVHDKSKNLFEI